MRGFKVKVQLAVVVVLAIWIGVTALYGLLRPISNGCIMTYMYPQYGPISTAPNVTSMKYGLYSYHEGWQKIDFKEHLKKLSGVPVLFIPGNGGSYKQVRSLAAQSVRAYQGGPLVKMFYQEASHVIGRGDLDTNMPEVPLPNQYHHMLDWFTVDLEGEHSAMDGRILEEHTAYVVYAIHRILDQYRESHDALAQEGAARSVKLPKSVILVGHSIGGFIARAAIMHPHLRKAAVETVLTLSCPHQSPPFPLQPSLGHYYAHVNQEWRKGYEVQTSQSGHYVADPPLSHVVVVSISAGYHDYQVRSKLESLDGIVPPTHGFMITTKGIKNVWLSMEHQAILWCNQLVVQVSHTLLSLIDSESGQPVPDVQYRLAIFTKMLLSAMPQNVYLPRQSYFTQKSTQMASQHGDSGTQVYGGTTCPSNVHWPDDGHERDLYVQTPTVTVLAMDGRRRWLDIHKLGSNGRSYFIFVTNLSPCSGVRLHLWPEKGNSTSESLNQRVLEVTSSMVQVSSGPAPRQVEPGSQTEQASPSAVFWLDLNDVRGFRFLTISVAPQPTVSGRPPPSTSMGVGQFFNPQEGQRKFSPVSSLLSMFSQKDMILEEDHPLAFNLSFSISLGLLPVYISIQTTGCGITKSEFSFEDPEDPEIRRLCKLRCFPPVAIASDATSGIHMFPTLYSEMIIVDASPALWNSIRGSEETTVLLLVDPHCSYKTSVRGSVTAAAGRFFLLYFTQIFGLCSAVVFFALMRQAHAWELDHPIPSMLSAVDLNMQMPLPFLYLAMLPILFALFISCLCPQPLPPVISFTVISLFCYLLANGALVMLIATSQLAFYAAATMHILIKKRCRWQAWDGCLCFRFLHWLPQFSTDLMPLKVVRILKTNPSLATVPVAVTLVSLVHPALGLFVLLLLHTFCCHNALTSSLMASLSSHTQSKEFLESENDGERGSLMYVSWYNDKINNRCPPANHTLSSPDSARSYSDTQLEIFHHWHGLLILHLLAMLSFVPSLMAWLQRIDVRHSFPWLLDSVLSLGVILHGVCDSRPEYNFLFPLPGIQQWEIKLSCAYLVAGYFCYISALAVTPYRAFYAMASIGVISFAYRIVQRRNMVKGETCYHGRKHSHRH